MLPKVPLSVSLFPFFPKVFSLSRGGDAAEAAEHGQKRRQTLSAAVGHDSSDLTSIR